MPSTYGQDRVDAAAEGFALTLHEARELQDRTSNLSPREARNFEVWLADYETRERQRLQTNVNNSDDLIEQTYHGLLSDADGMTEMAQRIASAVEVGEMPMKDARRELTGIFRSHGQLQQRAAGLRSNDELTDELAARDPADDQAELMRKYPALRTRLPLLSRRDLKR